jgi:hypothetical protein
MLAIQPFDCRHQRQIDQNSDRRCPLPLLQSIMDTQEQLTGMVTELSHESSAQANLRIVSSIQVTRHSCTPESCAQTPAVTVHMVQ